MITWRWLAAPILALAAAVAGADEPESQVLTGPKGETHGVAWSPDGKWLVSGGGDKLLWWWDAASGTAKAKEKAHEDEIFAVAWSRDGKLVATAGKDGDIWIWDANRRKALRKFDDHEGIVSCVAFGNDNTLASGGADGTLRIWDLRTYTQVRSAQLTDKVQGVAFSPDGSRIVTGDEDNIVTVFDSAGLRRQHKMAGHKKQVAGVAFSSDGRLAASGSDDGMVRIWDPATGRAIRSLPGHDALVFSVSFSSDGKRLASGGDDKTIRVWDIATWEELHTLDMPRAVSGVAWSPNGKVLASSCHDSTVVLWFWDRVAPPPDKKDLAKKQLRNLSDALRAFETDKGFLPHSVNSGMVNALQTGPRDGYYRFNREELNARKEVIDPWGNAIVYRSPGARGASYDIYSMGPNGRDDGCAGDDVGNW